MQNSTQRQKGFNLIEIAIVLAVIGLIVGGIYTAASAVTENNRRQRTQTELLTIAQNVRTTFASQSDFQVPNNAQINQMRLYPGSLFYDGTDFFNAYGGTVTLGRVGATVFQVNFNGISQGGCVELLTKSFGSQSNVQQIGLSNAGQSTGAATIAAVADISNGINVTEANDVCDNSDPVNVGVRFTLRG